MKRVKTTRKQFIRFARRVRRAWDAVGMSGWQLIMLHTEMDDDVCARTDREWCQRRITIRMNTTTPVNSNFQAFWDEMAVHEVAHAVLAPLGCLAGERYLAEEDLNSAEHEVVRRIVPLIQKSM